jgi:hypothetical protein
MMNKQFGQLFALSAAITLAGCSDSNSRSSSVLPPTPAPVTPTQSYEFVVTNTSYAQPLSPLAVILHDGDYRGWALGDASSIALEELAEGGDNAAFLSAANVMETISGSGVLLPGANEVLEATIDEASVIEFTLASMLVNSNDAFIGVTGEDISTLAVGETRTLWVPVFDAGTEANMELPGSIPGPADGGEGFNEARDDTDYVARHPGVVTTADGYAESVLNESHRFDAPVAMLAVTRTE